MGFGNAKDIAITSLSGNPNITNSYKEFSNGAIVVWDGNALGSILPKVVYGCLHCHLPQVYSGKDNIHLPNYSNSLKFDV